MKTLESYNREELNLSSTVCVQLAVIHFSSSAIYGVANLPAQIFDPCKTILIIPAMGGGSTRMALPGQWDWLFHPLHGTIISLLNSLSHFKENPAIIIRKSKKKANYVGLEPLHGHSLTSHVCSQLRILTSQPIGTSHVLRAVFVLQASYVVTIQHVHKI